MENVLSEGSAQTQNLNEQSLESQQQPEKTLRQSEVNAIVGRVKSEAYNKGKQEGLMEFQKTQPESSMSANPTNYSQPQQVQQPAMTHADIQKMIAEETRKGLEAQAQAVQAQQVVGEFLHKMAPGAEKYSDFKDKVAQLNLPDLVRANPALLYLVNATDNVPDVMYELANNPAKIASLMTLSSNPQTLHLARMEMQGLSTSIKQNQSAANTPQAKEPLNHIRPSTTGMDNGKMGIRDLKQQPWLRG